MRPRLRLYGEWNEETSLKAIPPTTRAQLAADYLESCRRHNTPPIDSVLQQIRELPEGVLGGAGRAGRLTLASCSLLGSAPCDALEAVLHRAQFRRIELECVDIDDEGAEALFDMIEYYESASVVSISGPRHFGIRGWQAASRMIKKSAELSELEVSDAPIESTHTPVLARALRPHSCRLRALCLQRASLKGEPLLCLVIALKVNRSVRELRLCDNGLSSADAAQLAALLRLNTRIQLLDLSNNQIQDAGVGHIADALVEQAAQTPPSPGSSPLSPHHCPIMSGFDPRGLAFLVLWNNQLTRNCAHNLGRMVRASKSLCVLNVGRNAIGSSAVRALLGCGALLSLGLQGARLTGDAAPLLQAALATDTQLQRARGSAVRALLSLGLQGARLTGDAAPLLQAALATDTQLQRARGSAVRGLLSLGLQGARLTGDAAPLLQAALATDTQLQGARLTGDSAPLLQAALATDTQLQRIDLRDNRLGVAGLQAIISAMESNKTLTQIDLDDPPESTSLLGEDSEAATVARLTRVVRAHCRRNEPAAAASPERRVHRKISLTCHTSCLARGMGVEEERRGGRLRSPAPSPAGSPVPTSQPSRFSVTRVTPDRAPTPDLSSPSGMRPGYSTPSRFKVVQVAETPQIQVQSATPDAPRRSASRFSVTRNMDNQYNPTYIPSPPPTPMPTKSRPSCGLGSGSEKESGTDNVSKRLDLTDSPSSAITSEKKTKDDSDSDDTGKSNDAASKAVSDIVWSDDNKVRRDDSVGEIVISVPSEDAPVICNDELEKTSKSDVKLSDVNSVPVSDKDCTNVDNKFHDKSEVLSHDEAVSVIGDSKITKSETKLVKTSTAVSDNEKIDVKVSVTVNKESVDTAKARDQINNDHRNTEVVEKRDKVAMKQIEAITEDLGNLIQEMRDRSKTVKAVKVKSDCTQTDVNIDSKLDTFDDVPVINRDNVVLKKNKSESSLDSPDLEVSRLMNKKLVGSAFCDSSSSLEISGSSMESLNAIDNQTAKPIIIQESVESDSELDRRKSNIVLSTESSIESTSEVTPVNSGNFLNMSVSSNESVSPIIFGKNKKIHGSLSSLEASVSSLESRHEKVMVTSADSGIEYSLQNPTENKEDNSSNEGTLTNNSSFKEIKKDGFQLQETLTCSPKRTSSLLDVPALKTKGLDRMRKISWVAPSASFHIPRPEPEKESKIPGHLEKLLSLFQHPSSIFSRSTEDEKKSTSNTPPRKDSSLTSSFWSWGSATEKTEEREDRDSLSEATDSTLSERVQVSFVDESFSKKLDSKTPSTDTDNTLSEFQSFPHGNSESEADADKVKVTDETTDDNLVQKCLGLSLNSDASANGNKDVARACDTVDLNKPNDLNKNYDSNKNAGETEKTDKVEPVRPRSFAAVLKASSSENSLEKQSPETGQPVDKLPSKVIRGIKENISPENTLTSTMTKALAFELTEKQVKNQPIVNTVWEVTRGNEPRKEEVKELAPIATIEETCDETLENTQLDFIDDIKFIDDKNVSGDSGVTLESTEGKARELEHVDLGKDALSYLIYENQDYEPEVETSAKTQSEPSLAQELRDAEIKEQLLDLSPELVIDEAVEVPEVFTKDVISLCTSPVIPERAKLKKCNSLEDISQSESEQKKTIAFKVPDVVSTPRDIPERRTKLRSRSGSSPKSLPESLNKPSPLTKMESVLTRKKKKVSSLGKIARDSLLALNMSEDEMAEFRRSYKLTSVESLRSLESVSEDANSQSNSVDSRCRSCLRTSQESLMSLDSINEDCRCGENSEKPSRSGR
ncbi:hypothetical protein MSG28_015868 [Choristoneura fumiferana]|uniref:Uncharacterized protein n=1 Tax=Choristoneura fumiferana TaxID=7141 RepID=A0ACC0K4J9_CHOFU|nr:hypothetical protein MSG28_015868 [Choristoneura fumiferana]